MMAERMAGRAKQDIDSILQQLHAISPAIDRIAGDCDMVLKANLDTSGAYISPRTATAFAEMRNAIAALYRAGHGALIERDRFSGREELR